VATWGVRGLAIPRPTLDETASVFFTDWELEGVLEILLNPVIVQIRTLESRETDLLKENSRAGTLTALSIQPWTWAL
jgi:hypothetical protein